uniref:Uncharacterized protein n=1 Tax=Photinus pyralis TaxID=7054 RepID=A0A1Y1L087_PHOPY
MLKKSFPTRLASLVSAIFRQALKRSSQLQCIKVFTLQLNSPYLVSNPPIQKGHAVSCLLQHLSVRENPPSSVYFSAEKPLPHHLVPGICSQSTMLRFLLLSQKQCDIVKGFGL